MAKGKTKSSTSGTSKVRPVRFNKRIFVDTEGTNAMSVSFRSHNGSAEWWTDFPRNSVGDFAMSESERKRGVKQLNNMIGLLTKTRDLLSAHTFVRATKEK